MKKVVLSLESISQTVIQCIDKMIRKKIQTKTVFQKSAIISDVNIKLLFLNYVMKCIPVERFQAKQKLVWYLLMAFLLQYQTKEN